MDGGLIEPTPKAFARCWDLLPVVASSSFESPVPFGESSLISHLDCGTILPTWLESTLSSLRIKLWFYKSYLGLLLNEAWYDKVMMITFEIPLPVNKNRGDFRNITKVCKLRFKDCMFALSETSA